MDRAAEIQEMVDRESRAYQTYDVELMMSIFHPDMVWVWPPNSRAYDPMEWVLRIMANLLRPDELGPAEGAYKVVARLVAIAPEP